MRSHPAPKAGNRVSIPRTTITGSLKLLVVVRGGRTPITGSFQLLVIVGSSITETIITTKLRGTTEEVMGLRPTILGAKKASLTFIGQNRLRSLAPTYLERRIAARPLKVEKSPSPRNRKVCFGVPSIPHPRWPPKFRRCIYENCRSPKWTLDKTS